MQQVDFLATQPQYFDHIAPVWDALSNDNRGTFYVPIPMIDYAVSRLKHRRYLFGFEDNSPDIYGLNPILVAAFGDMKYSHRISPERRIFMMEHGTGHGFGGPAWPNGKGDRDLVSLFLAPNKYTAYKIREVRSTPIEVIGTPKLDWIAQQKERLLPFYSNYPPVVCISFHHGSRKRRPPEAGSAFEHYKDYISTLKQNPAFQLVAHGHPLSRERDVPFYKSIGVPFLHDFVDVLKGVDIYVNDLSSTLYEFSATGKPVVVMNAPWFRKDVHHGLRFWDYSNIGIHVEEPEQLPSAIMETYHNDPCIVERHKAVSDLYPFFGYSAKRAADVIREELSEEKDLPPTPAAPPKEQSLW
jgi:hypothetical protein